MQVSVKFTASPPPAGKTFYRLRLILADAGGTVKTVELSPAQVQAAAVVQPDGSYLLPVTFDGVAVGAYSVTAQASDATGAVFGPIASGSGSVSLADGVWYPAPTGFA